MVEEKLVPKLRFPDFHDEWSENILSNICEINPRTEVPEKFNYIDLESVNSGFLTQTQEIDREEAPSRAQRKLNKNDILFATVRPYQQNNYYFNLDGDYVASTGYAQIRSLENPEYLYYFIHTKKFLNDVLKRCTGTSYPAINSNDLKTIKIKKPTIPEQEKISSFLSKFDKKMELLEKKYHDYQEFKKYLLQNIFSQKLRFDFNEEWEYKKLGKVSSVKDGTHDSPKYVSDGYPLITSKNLLNGSIDFNNVNYISKEDYDTINKRSNVDKGDILFGMIGTIGNPVIVESDEFAIKNVALIKEKKELLNSFLIHILETDIIKRQFYRLNAGGTQKFIALGLIKDLSVPVPSMDEQVKISEFLNLVTYKENMFKNQVSQMKNFKTGLLQQMFV